MLQFIAGLSVGGVVTYLSPKVYDLVQVVVAWVKSKV